MSEDYRAQQRAEAAAAREAAAQQSGAGARRESPRQRTEQGPTADLPRGARLNIVQCPGGGPLRYAIRNNFFVGYGDKSYQIRYLTDTVKGSSGAPVLDDNWQAVGLHRGFKKVNPDLYKGEAGKSEIVKFHNEGIVIHDILAQLPHTVLEEIKYAQGWD